MSFPKKKRRTIVVDGITYHWCFSKGTIYWKEDKPSSQLFQKYLGPHWYGLSVTPDDVKHFILQS